MNSTDFTITLQVDQTAEQVFNAINNVSAWWSEDFKGQSQKTGDEFEVRFGDVHYSKHKLIEVIQDQKVVWLVMDSNLNFLKNKSEWNGTKNSFEISVRNNKTHICFTHVGLVPEIECFNDCSKGWTYFIEQSLLYYIINGKGIPHSKENDCTSLSSR